MSLLKKAEFCVRKIETYFVLERRKQYWTRLMTANVAALTKKSIGGG